MSEKLNYHKLVNLRKRFDKYGDCDISKEIVAVIEKHLVLEKRRKRARKRILSDDLIISIALLNVIFAAKNY